MDNHVIEGLWDCVYCNQKEIKARYDACPYCGKGRGIETIFYLPANKEAATLSQEAANKISRRADWLCDYCGSYNNFNNTVCTKCGSNKKEATKDYGLLHKLTGKLFGKKQ